MRIKRILALLLAAALCLSLAGCQKAEVNEEDVQAIAQEYSKAVVMAKDAFEEKFSGLENLSIENCETLLLPDKDYHIVVVFRYTSDGGDGEYGFECEHDEDGNWVVAQQGENITVENLTGK